MFYYPKGLLSPLQFCLATFRMVCCGFIRIFPLLLLLTVTLFFLELGVLYGVLSFFNISSIHDFSLQNMWHIGGLSIVIVLLSFIGVSASSAVLGAVHESVGQGRVRLSCPVVVAKIGILFQLCILLLGGIFAASGVAWVLSRLVNPVVVGITLMALLLYCFLRVFPVFPEVLWGEGRLKDALSRSLKLTQHSFGFIFLRLLAWIITIGFFIFFVKVALFFLLSFLPGPESGLTSAQHIASFLLRAFVIVPIESASILILWQQLRVKKGQALCA